MITRPDHPHGGFARLAVFLSQVLPNRLDKSPVGGLVGTERLAWLAPADQAARQIVVPDSDQLGLVQKLRRDAARRDYSELHGGLLTDRHIRSDICNIDIDYDVTVVHSLMLWHESWPPPGRHVAYATYEADRLPERSVAALNKYDRVLVPSRQNLEVFRNSGVVSAAS